MFVFVLGGWYAHRSSSSWRSTSPMICPMLCSALRSSSVLSNCFLVSFTSSRSLRTLASSSCGIERGSDGSGNGQTEVTTTSRDLFACPKKSHPDLKRPGVGPARGRDARRRSRARGGRRDSYLVLQHEPSILADRRLLGIGRLHRRRNLRRRHDGSERSGSGALDPGLACADRRTTPTGPSREGARG